MDLQEKRQLTRVPAGKRTRLAKHWRAMIALALAIVTGAMASIVGADFGNQWFLPEHVMAKLITASATAGFCLFAAIAVVGMSGAARDLLQPLTGAAHAAVVRYAIGLIGGISALIIALSLAKVPIGKLVVGGALTTILLGIAAQASLANLFAGLMLLLSRPFAVGDRIRLRSGALGGLIEGTVTEIGITYVRMATTDGPLHLPNSQVLAAAVGPVPPAQPEPAEDRTTPPSPAALSR